MTETHPLTAYRKRQKPPLSLAELARAIGVQPNTVWRWENGRLPDQNVWPKISRATGVRPEDLVRFADRTDERAEGVA